MRGAMGAMQLCHHHDRRVAKNRKLGFRGHVRSTKFDVDWERRCFALRVVSSFDKNSLLSLDLIIGSIFLPVLLFSFEGDTAILEAESQARVVDVLDS